MQGGFSVWLIYQNAKFVFNLRMTLTINEIRKLNLQILIAEIGGKKSKLATMADTDPAYISQILSTKGKKPRNMGDDLARKLEIACKKPRGWMDTFHQPSEYIKGEVMHQDQKKIAEPTSNAEWHGGFDLWDSKTPLRDDEVELPFYREVELSAGSGRTEVQENHGLKLRFAKSTLRKMGVAKANAACVIVSGNSMEPVLPDGAAIGIDTSKTTLKNGDMYAIDHNGHLRVKLVYKTPNNGIRLRSFNSDEWPDEYYSGESVEKIKILGRVFWYSVLRY
jgi:phage repressor protein C with HTH and peptisase S24 domain